MPATRAPIDMLALSAQPAELAEALDVLGLPADASPEQAARRYRELVRHAHPDLHRRTALQHLVATERTAQINAAWEVVRPAAEALAAHHRRVASQRSRVVRTLNPAAARAGARVISADNVRIERPRVIPVPAPGGSAAGAERGAA